MNLASDTLVSLAWNQFVQVTAVALGVGLVVRVACRRRPHLAYALWMLVIVKSLTPPLWSSPTGVFSWLGAETRVMNPDAPAGGFAGMPYEPVPHVENSGGTGVSPVLAKRRQGTGRMPVPPTAHLVLAGWLAGVALMNGGLLVRRIRGVRLLRHSAVPADESLKDHVHALAQRIGLRRSVRITVSREPVGPAVFGMLRPTIVLPARLLAEKPPRELEPILAHELVHLRRGDTLAGGLQAVAQILWWFHPLVWWSNRAARRERERCCDQEVVARLGCRPAEYARSLLHILEWRRTLRPMLGLPATGTWSITSLRLEEIMRNARVHRKTPRWVWLVAATTAALILPGAGIVQFSESDARDENAVEIETAVRKAAGLQIAKERGSSKMMHIALAMHLYAMEHQEKLPTAASYAAGEPLLSWRVHILPYLDEQNLYNEFHLDEPWDSEHNRELIKRMPAIYACPGQKTDEGKTCFLAPSGEKTLFPPQVADGIPLNDIPDGLGHTILVVDANDKHAVVWTKPEDFKYDSKENPIPELVGHHQGGFSIVLADSSWFFVPEAVDLKKLHAHFTYNGGEVITGGLLD